MFRKLIVSGALALGVLSPLAAAPAVQAEPNHFAHHRHFVVQVRRDCHCPWSFEVFYDFRPDARHAARHLRHQGFETRI